MSALKILTTLAKITSFAWWMYVVVILSLFFGGLLLNYIVKKINEVRLETRFSLRSKAAANQSTQVQRTMEIENRPSGNIAGKLIRGISLVFNKEENLLEDKRRKDDTARTNENSTSAIIISMNSSDGIEEETTSAREEEMNKSVFLGTIYKELYEKRVAIEKSKSLSNADRDSILSEIVDKMVWKINESKSTPSIRKLIDVQNEEDLKDWALDLIKKKDKAPKSTEPPSTSGFC